MSSLISKLGRIGVVPSDAFTRCPHCEAGKLLRFDGEVFCTRCDWSSISSTLDAIGLRAFSLGGGLCVEDLPSEELEENFLIA